MKTLRFLLAVSGLALAVAGLAAGPAGAVGQTAAADGQPAAIGSQFVILDTDIGDDIDDAFALALALRSPEIDLLGITTTYGDTELRAKLVDRFLDAACYLGIPVVPGGPTWQENVLTQARYASGAAVFECVGSFLGDRRRAKNARLAEQKEHDDAEGFLLDEIRAYPNRITLIAIGPLFNVQAAIERDPEADPGVRRLAAVNLCELRSARTMPQGSEQEQTEVPVQSSSS